MSHVFNPKDLAKLDNPDRSKMVNPKEVLKEMGLRSGDRFLDFGIGTGFFARAAIEIIGQNGFLYGVDIYDEMLEAAQIKLQGFPNCKLFKVTDIILPSEIEKVDFAFMGFVLHEIEKRQQILHEIKRVMGDQSFLGVMEWDIKNFEKGPPATERLSISQSADILEDSGFTIVKQHQYNQYFYYLLAQKA